MLKVRTSHRRINVDRHVPRLCRNLQDVQYSCSFMKIASTRFSITHEHETFYVHKTITKNIKRLLTRTKVWRDRPTRVRIPKMKTPCSMGKKTVLERNHFTNDLQFGHERGNKAFICHTEWSDQRQEHDVIDLIRASFPCCRPVGNPTCDLSNLRFLVCTAFQLCTPFRFTNTPRAYVERLQSLRVTARSWQIQQHLWFATHAVRLHRGAPASPCAYAMKRVTRVLMIAFFSVRQSGSASR